MRHYLRLCIEICLICVQVFEMLIPPCTARPGPCSVKPVPQDYDHDILDTLYMSSDEDYYIEDDKVPLNSTLSTENLNLDVDPTVEEGPFLEGDIIPSASSHVVFSDYGLRWPNATVPFLFHNMMSYYGRIQVLRAMNEYHNHTCIQFKKRQGEKDYLVIGSSYPQICASSVGRQGGAQLLHLGPACTHSIGTPMHELMHALGFFHEHMRPDRDRYVFINYSNIDEALWKNFREVHFGLMLNDLGAGYDFGSLMHYRLCAMTNNTWPTIVPKVYTRIRIIGQRRGFSRKDITKLNNFYNCTAMSRSPRMFNFPNRKSPSTKSFGATSCDTLYFIIILYFIASHWHVVFHINYTIYFCSLHFYFCFHCTIE